MSGPRVYRSLEDAKGQFGPCALAIGNFDGVHVGHRSLIDRTRAFASEQGIAPAVLTFHPHPAVVVSPDRKVQHLVDLERKLQLLTDAGVQRILVLPFTRELSKLSPREFVLQVLVEALDTKGVFVGDNFRFGYKQAGDNAALQQLGAEYGFTCEFLPCVRVRGEIASSSLIRNYVAAGQVARACRILGRPFAVEGMVVSGHGVGSKQTVPTLNLKPEPNQVLPRGVFVTETHDLDHGTRWPSITNIGIRPTFDGDELTIETYLLAPLQGPAPERIRVDFRRFVRREQVFPSPDLLKAQILRDVVRAQSYWRRLQRERANREAAAS